MKIKRENVDLDIKKLIPYAKNARTHSMVQVAQIAASMKEWGFTNPCLIDEKNNIIAGHGRVLGAEKAGIATIPCVRLSGLSEAQKRALILADNKLALNAEWDEKLLLSELEFLDDAGYDFTLTGFTDEEMEALGGGDVGNGTGDEEAVPEAPVTPRTVLGDVWLLGKHRVACGDSTSATAVDALLAGAKPHLMATDPPYGVEYDASWRSAENGINSKGSVTRKGVVENDGRADWREAWALFPGNIAYVWHGGLHAGVVAESLQSCDFKLRTQIIWLKQKIVFGRGDYHWQHEPCWYAVKGTGKWTGDRKQSSIWEISNLNQQSAQAKENDHTNHSTQKPVECMRRPMLNNSDKGDLVYDPFLGSGTTVIAAETEGRVCYGMELSPQYVDVIVKRWQDFTGLVATLESTGESFDGKEAKAATATKA